MKIYYASPFFEKGNFEKSAKLVNAIRKEFGDRVEIYLPQENGDINDKSDIASFVSPKDISDGDNKYLIECDMIIADLDGPVIDDGVAAEIGFVAGMNTVTGSGKVIVGYNTDIRLNPVDEEFIDLIVENKDDKEWCINAIENLKYNHLYRNLYVRGLVETHGYYLQTGQHYLEEGIIDIIKTELK